MGVTEFVFIAGTLLSVQQARSAERAQRRAAERREQVQRQQNFRRKQQELRQARAARARAVAQGTAAGVETGGTSAVQGTVGSVQSQAASNISFLDDLNRAGAAITSAENEARGHQVTSNLFGSIAGGSQQIGNIFDEATVDE